MVHIVNRLPKAVGGEISSENNNLYFTKDANWLGEYEYKVFENLPKLRILKGRFGRHVASINDDGFHNYPITIFYDDIGLGTYYCYYYNHEIHDFIFVVLKFPTEVQLNTLYDQFCAVDKNLFVILYNDSKSIYYASLPKNHNLITLTKLENIFNTTNGKIDGTEIKKPSILNILNNHLLFFGSLGSSENNLFRHYYWSEETKSLSYIGNYKNSENSPYKETGYFQQLSNSDILGINCNYTSNSGYNIYYHIIEKEDHTFSYNFHESYIFNNFSTTNCMYRATSDKNGAWFWKNQLRMVSYNSNNTYHTHFSLNGTSFYESSFDYTNPSLIMGLNDYQFLYIPRKINKEYLSTKLILSTIGNNTLNTNELQTFSDHMLLLKIPGVPIIYCDTYSEDEHSNIYYYCSLIKGFPMLLTSGSTLNGQEITSTHLSFPKSGSSLKIHLNTGGLNGHIYSQRNDDEGYII